MTEPIEAEGRDAQGAGLPLEDLVPRVEPVQEPDVVAVEPVSEPEVEVAAAEPEPAPAPEVAEPEPEPEVVAAEAPAEPEPEVVAAEAPAEPAMPVEPEPEVVAAAVIVPKDPDAVSIWPFVGYVGIWVLYAGVLIWQLSMLPAGQAAFESDPYRVGLLGGLILLIAGPILTLATWFAAWDRPGSTRMGLFLSAFMRGAVAMFLGTCLWWVALVALDRLRLGRFL